MRPFPALLLALALAWPARAAIGPADAMLAASADLASLESYERSYTRYLWVNEPTPEATEKTIRTLNAHLNSVSLSPNISVPGVVRSGPVTLLRLRLDHYNWSPETWDKLQEQDDSFHAQLVELWSGGPDPKFGGKVFPAGRYILTAHAPWIAETPEQYRALAYLATETRSKAPILAADYFVWETSIQAGREVGYYGILGIKTRRDYFKLAGFHEEDLTLRPETLAVVSPSRISQEPRRIGRFPTDGGLWRTFDNEKATKNRNPLTFLDKGFRFDAEEDFAKLPNSWWFTGLFKEDGTRQDSAPDFIGYHHQTRSNDGRIHVGTISCFGCHDAVAGNGGLQGVDDFVRATNSGPKFRLGNPLDYDLARVLNDKYGPSVRRKLDDDRAGYVRALKEASGFEPHEWARAEADVFYGYEEPIDIVGAARRMGVDAMQLQSAIEAYSVNPRTRESQDLMVAGLARGRTIGVNQFHEIVNLLHLEYRGLVAWDPKLKGRVIRP